MRDDERSEPFDLALNLFERKAIKGLLVASGADQNFRRTLRAIAGNGFSQPELDQLEERILRKATRDDVGVLYGITEGAPVVISRNQKATIDRLLNEAGTDELGRRARDAYGRALKHGQVKIH